MNIQNLLLIFILVIGTLFFIGSTVPTYPMDNPVENLESIINETTPVKNPETIINETTKNQITEEKTPENQII